MAAANVDVTDLPTGSMLEEIRRSAEERLRLIEPLIEEAERLRDVLDLIDAQQPGAGGRRAGRGAPAPRGANKRMILDLVAERPGVATGEIAAETGIAPTVVRSTVSRLKRQGELEDHARGGVQIPAA
jgi:hypothetical protein